MKYVRLGRTGKEISGIGLGCASIMGTYGYASDAIDLAESLKVMHTALDHGINFLDTADQYGAGQSETLVGQFLKQVDRSRVVVATKFGSVGDVGQRSVNNHPDHIAKACDESLRRLGIDTIDLYYMHRRDPAVPLAESVGAMSQLVKAGKVRWLGLCEVAANTLREAHAVHPIAALQSEYSLWTREPEGDVFPACRELGTTFVPFSPLGRAFLTGTVASGDDFPPQDLRAQLPRFRGDAAAQNRRLVEQFAAFAGARGWTPAQAALAWILAKNNEDFAIAPIPGTRRPKYVAENAQAAKIALSPADVAELDALFSPAAVAGPRYNDEEAARAGH